MSALDGTMIEGRSASVVLASELVDEDDARAVAAAMIRAAAGGEDWLTEHEAVTGQVPLAARGGARFAHLVVVPALRVGRMWAPDVSAWVLGYEGRTFLRLVNIDPDEAPVGSLASLPGPGPRPERRMSSELPFALEELSEDRVYELIPSLQPGQQVIVEGDEDWTMPDGSYDGRLERRVLRDGWGDLLDAYTNSMTPNQGARRAQFGAALRRLLWIDEAATKPRHLRPWALLTLQSLVAEILQGSPRTAKGFGVAALARHPQCYPSLAHRLRRA